MFSRFVVFSGSVFRRRTESSLRQFRMAEGWLALTLRMVSFAL
jgi:hypothetical protein